MDRDGIRIGLDYGEGADVDAMRNGTDRIGQVIAAVDNEQQIDQIMDRVYRCIRLDDRPMDELWKEARKK